MIPKVYGEINMPVWIIKNGDKEIIRFRSKVVAEKYLKDYKDRSDLDFELERDKQWRFKL